MNYICNYYKIWNNKVFNQKLAFVFYELNKLTNLWAKNLYPLGRKWEEDIIYVIQKQASQAQTSSLTTKTLTFADTKVNNWW